MDAARGRRRLFAPIAACTVMLVSSATGAATIVTGTNISLSAGGPLGEFTLTVFQDAEGTDPTSVFFEYDGTHVEIVNWNVDEESDWYLAFADDVFSARNIESAVFTTLFTTDSPRGPIFVGSGDFFLAVNTGQGEDASGPNRDVFGWVELSNTGTELVQLGNAVAYGFRTPDAPGNGIVVGTATAVPEPSALALVAIGLVALCRLRAWT